jgi:hypothetical protein
MAIVIALGLNLLLPEIQLRQGRLSVGLNRRGT